MRVIDALLGVVIAVAAVSGACSGGGSGVAGGGGHSQGGADGGGAAGAAASSGSAGSGGSGFDAGGDASTTLVIDPQAPTVTVQTGQPLPTVAFQVKANGAPVSAKWLIDRAEIGAIDNTGLFTPTGKVAGQATIEATVGAQTLSTTVTVKLELVDNGAAQTDAGPGGGGYLGVGGEGLGPAPDPSVQATLQSPPTADPSMTFLYPYDKTVWPLGMLAPLLQWTPGSGAVADGVTIHLTATNFDYKGSFGRPAPLAAGAPFVRHPIPQDAWDAATESAAGGKLTATVVVAAGGVAYGPISETWTIAKGRLKGTVYYQSYGTKLAKNFSGAIGGDGMFGGATLAIKPGATDPVLVAGSNGGAAQCRVCHSVSADGTRMIVQHGDDYQATSSYDLNNGYAETAYPGGTNGQLGWAGLFRDGSIGIGNGAPLPGGANTVDAALYDMTTGAVIPSTGLTGVVTRAGMPAFSPDGSHVAFNFYAGPGDGTSGAGDGKKLVTMDFDLATHTFSNLHTLYSGADPGGWPTFLPGSDAVVFQVAPPGGSEFFATRDGSKGELWWADLATGTAHPLDRVNGKDGGVLTLPIGPGNHADDSQLDYEPTVSPIPSGGYAWVVFTSRRMYGSVATIDPWWSDPRFHDLTTTPTTKKLWVAAIDLSAPPGTDPGHPAFYLPGQELLAGNSRGFWVVDPCKQDGNACTSGDECCGGYCQQDPQTGALTCGSKQNNCSNEFDKCTTASDCCDATLKCINNTCSTPAPPK